MSELRVLLLGNSWCQRRNVGNFILEKSVFSTEELDCCVRVRGQCMRNDVVLINAPDFLCPNLCEDKLREHVEDCVRLSDPGPHVFLLVLQPEDFTEEQKLKLQTVLEDCGDQSLEHSLVLISTSKEECSTSIENYKQYPVLKDMVKMCGFRHLYQKNLELQELLVRLGQIMRENSGNHVACDLSRHVTVRSHHNLNPVPVNFDPARTAACGLRIVLFGKSEEEKTTLGNFIMKMNSFEFQRLPPPSQCECADGEWEEEPLTVVKTPNIFTLSVETVREEMKRCVSLCPPGPNALLLLVRPSDFTENNRKALKFILSCFGEDAFKHSMVVRTYNHQCEETSVSVNKLFQDCDGRHYNISKGDRTLLMEGIQKMVTDKEHWLTFMEEGPPTKEDNIEALKKEQRQCLENQQLGYEQKLQEEETKYTTLKEEFENQRVEYENKIKEEQSKRKDEENVRKELEEKYKREMDGMKMNSKELTEKYTKDVEALLIKHKEEIQKLKEEHRKESNLLHEHLSMKEQEVMRLQQEKNENRKLEELFKKEMDDVKMEFQKARKQAKEFREKCTKYLEVQMKYHEEEIQKIMEEHRKESNLFHECFSQKEQEVTRLQEEEKKRRELEEKNKREMEEMKIKAEEYRENLEAQIKKHKEVIQKIKEEHKKESNLFHERFCQKEQEVTRLQEEEKKRRELEEKNKREMEEMKIKAEEYRENLEAQIKKPKQEIQKIKEEPQKIVSLQADQLATACPNAEPLRIALIGRGGCGKSSSGNTILGRTEFRAKMSSTPVTLRYKTAKGEFNGRRLVVLDTPELFDTHLSTEMVIKEVVSLLDPGPHAFLLVLGRFTEKEMKMFKLFRVIVRDFLIVLFTHGDDLEDELSIEEVIGHDSSLKEFLRDCGGRYHVFNNKSRDPTQVSELITKINTMVVRNGRYFSTNELLRGKDELQRLEDELQRGKGGLCVCF
ncbi:uncharacterized protein KZ484_004544 isoform 2-T2 [Pholidichthys leucotaenia]